jgi:hypothetical protein
MKATSLLKSCSEYPFLADTVEKYLFSPDRKIFRP